MRMRASFKKCENQHGGWLQRETTLKDLEETASQSRH